MEFLKIGDLWTYQLPEWDNYDKEDMENALGEIDGVSIKEYTMAPDSDIYTLIYEECEFFIVNDIAYGCDIRSSDKENLPQMEKLVKKFKL